MFYKFEDYDIRVKLEMSATWLEGVEFAFLPTEKFFFFLQTFPKLIEVELMLLHVTSSGC